MLADYDRYDMLRNVPRFESQAEVDAWITSCKKKHRPRDMAEPLDNAPTFATMAELDAWIESCKDPRNPVTPACSPRSSGKPTAPRATRSAPATGSVPTDRGPGLTGRLIRSPLRGDTLPENVRPVDALRMAEEAAQQLALTGIINAAKAPLLARIEELERDLTAALSRAEKAETEREEFRRRLQDDAV